MAGGLFLLEEALEAAVSQVVLRGTKSVFVFRVGKAQRASVRPARGPAPLRVWEGLFVGGAHLLPRALRALCLLLRLILPRLL